MVGGGGLGANEAISGASEVLGDGAWSGDGLILFFDMDQPSGRVGHALIRPAWPGPQPLDRHVRREEGRRLAQGRRQGPLLPGFDNVVDILADLESTLGKN